MTLKYITEVFSLFKEADLKGKRWKRLRKQQ